MINKHTEQVTEEKEIIDSIVCNRCGKPVHTAKSRCGETMYVDYIPFNQCLMHRHRYSEFIEDFDLCEDCINEIVSEFKIPVKKFEL